MDDHILQSRHEIRNAGDLETFRERFRGLCWLDGPNSLISMLYLSYLMWCGSWEHDVMSVCSVFRLQFLLHVAVFWNSILKSGWPFCSWFWGWSRELCSQDGVDIGWCICIENVNKYNVVFDFVGHSTWSKENTLLIDDDGRCLCSCAEGKKNNGVSNWLY